MVRSCRVYLNDLNPGKALILKTFLYLCHAVCQYFVDLFWQRQDFGGQLSDLPTVSIEALSGLGLPHASRKRWLNRPKRSFARNTVSTKSASRGCVGTW
jgi:hypothetical protein